MADEHIIKRLTPEFKRVDQEIRDQIDSNVSYVAEVCRYHLLSGGKRIRPVLFLLASRLCGYHGPDAYRMSAAVEFLHGATLLHDDVVDEADTRRGQRAAHMVYGNRGVILVGDFLLAKSLGLGAEAGRMFFIEIMAGVVAQMSEGEILQILFARKPDITEQQYEDIIYRKTGILIESSCRLGAVYAHAPDEWTEALRVFGRDIGLAFQIIDDTLDYRATEAEFGKPVGHDLDEGKVTLPLIRALARAAPTDRAELESLIVREQRSAGEFARVRELIDRYRGIEESVARASELVAQAKGALDCFPGHPRKTDLEDLADFIVARKR